MKQTGLRYLNENIPRYLEWMARHVTVGFDSAVQQSVAAQAADLKVDETIDRKFPVVFEDAETVLHMRLRRDRPYSVVMSFSSDCSRLIQGIENELAFWCEETEPDWPADRP